MTERSEIEDRCIFHVDMDAFFASIEQRDRPELRGRPVVVGGSGHRGVVAAASYEARLFGIRSAMAGREASRRCPDAIFVSARHAHYRSESSRIFELFGEISDLVEAISVDEAFLDMTGRLGQQDVVSCARTLKRRITLLSGLTASIGIGRSKLVARMASAYDKPDGLIWVPKDQERQFLDPLPVRRMPGIGKATAARLNEAGILTLGQLRRANLDILEPLLGRQAARFRERAAGRDLRPVERAHTRRSISQETTFGDNLSDREKIESVIAAQAEHCAEALQRKGLYARTVQLKLRSTGYSTLTRSQTLGGFTRSGKVIEGAAFELARAWMRYQKRLALRLIGVGVTDLSNQPAADELMSNQEAGKSGPP